MGLSPGMGQRLAATVSVLSTVSVGVGRSGGWGLSGSLAVGAGSGGEVDGECARRSFVDRGKLGIKPVAPGRGERHPARQGTGPGEPVCLPLLAPTLRKLDEIGPLPDEITVHLGAGYDSQKTCDELKENGMKGEIASAATSGTRKSSTPSSTSLTLLASEHGPRRTGWASATTLPASGGAATVSWAWPT